MPLGGDQPEGGEVASAGESPSLYGRPSEAAFHPMSTH